MFYLRSSSPDSCLKFSPKAGWFRRHPPIIVQAMEINQQTAILRLAKALGGLFTRSRARAPASKYSDPIALLFYFELGFGMNMKSFQDPKFMLIWRRSWELLPEGHGSIQPWLSHLSLLFWLEDPRTTPNLSPAAFVIRREPVGEQGRRSHSIFLSAKHCDLGSCVIHGTSMSPSIVSGSCLSTHCRLGRK